VLLYFDFHHPRTQPVRFANRLRAHLASGLENLNPNFNWRRRAGDEKIGRRFSRGGRERYK